MPMICNIRGCKSTWKKNAIKFHKFPIQNKKYLKYWIAATGRDDWIPHSNARICSLHFTNNNYYNNKKHAQKRYLKPDVIPTQHVHAKILQLLQENKDNQSNSIINKNQDEIMLLDKGENQLALPDTMQNLVTLRDEKRDPWTTSDKEHNLLKSSDDKENQMSLSNKEQELVNENNNGIGAAIPTCLKSLVLFLFFCYQIPLLSSHYVHITLKYINCSILSKNLFKIASLLAMNIAKYIILYTLHNL